MAGLWQAGSRQRMSQALIALITPQAGARKESVFRNSPLRGTAWRGVAWLARPGLLVHSAVQPLGFTPLTSNFVHIAS